ncbi:hypothetical protein H4Q26_005796 [Puccinia striiformis f. sp. tritici PST-130]|nr:hypothetical protein H4Q26_005796 [Puccinia striiformis f. sp. tritici PST-130]
MTHQETSLWDDSIPDNTAPLIGVIPAEGVHQFVNKFAKHYKGLLCQTLPPQSTSDGKIFANSLKSISFLQVVDIRCCSNLVNFSCAIFTVHNLLS